MSAVIAAISLTFAFTGLFLLWLTTQLIKIARMKEAL